MDHLEQEGHGGEAGYKDRKPGLVFFGLVQIAIGGITGLMALFQALMSTLPNPALEEAGAATPGGLVLFTAGFLAPVAVAFIWLGVGSIMARRWARDLSLVGGWLWMVFGIVGLFGLVMAFPSFPEAMEATAQEPSLTEEQAAMVGTVIMVGMALFHVVFHILLPGAFVLFFRSRNVRATCEAHDPVTRWTERCPLQVLAISIILAFGAYQCILAALSPFRLFPLFGTLIQGALAGVLLAGFAAVLAYLAWQLYHLAPIAWSLAVGISILGLASAILTNRGLDPADLFSGMEISEAQLESLTAAMPEPSALMVHMSVWGVVWVGYLLYCRRYFGTRGA
jgi:hypothetical protein